MKTIILAGGKGTRISEYTKVIPKPMIRIQNEPILISPNIKVENGTRLY